MTTEQVQALGPALAGFLAHFGCCFPRRPTLQRFLAYCRGLLSGLDRKSVEPMALAAGAAVRTLQEFLTHHRWDHLRLRDLIQRRVVARHAPPPDAPRQPDDPLAIGLIDETSIPKKGDKTPGVQRQYCGASGKIDNCIVTVHLGYVRGDFLAMLDSDLYLPQSWIDDRDRGGTRCRDAHIPDALGYRAKTDIALDQVRHALSMGVRFDFLTFDEGYGKNPAFLFGLEALGQCYVAEVPRNFRAWPSKPKYHSLRGEFATRKAYNIARWSKAFIYQDWQDFTLQRRTVEPVVWSVKAAQVHLRDPDTHRPTDRTYWLIVAWNRTTGEHKYYVANAPPTAELSALLRVAFQRAGVEHLFRIGKSEIGFDHYEGRTYHGLIRHMILCQLLLLFLAEHTARLRGEKSAGDDGADCPRPQRPLPTLA